MGSHINQLFGNSSLMIGSELSDINYTIHKFMLTVIKKTILE